MKDLLAKLSSGVIPDIIYDNEFLNNTNNLVINILNMETWDVDTVNQVYDILEISNILYNNTSNTVLILDDGVYDRLLERYKNYDSNYQIGAKPINFKESPDNEILDTKIMCSYINREDYENQIYIEDINSYKSMPTFNSLVKYVQEPITKRLINTQHKYPELVGTLDKCKCVIDKDAEALGIINDPGVKIFERDFIHHALRNNIISSSEEFEMVGELKYDGVSIEAEVCGDKIITALSRGDVADNIATDLTPIFSNFRFPYAGNVPKDEIFGIKFEAVITKLNMDRLSNIRGVSYANCRNAIIGLLGSSDAYLYSDFITLIPLASSLDFDSRIDELHFLNKYYNCGELNRFVIFRGDYIKMLFKVREYLKSAQIIRDILPYMIDGIVVSFTDKDKINRLGRVNSVNKYSMAIKFIPKKVRTIFLGYTFNIGKTGEVIPMVHFKPCEIMGGIHNKQTLHSYQRFKDLNLILGQQIDIEYRNDVLTYVSKPDTEFNRNIKGEPVEFIKNCPYCGTPIQISPTGKSAKCVNPYCPERAILRMVSMLDKLGFTDFSKESIKTLKIYNLMDLLNENNSNLPLIGPINSLNFVNQIKRLKTEPIKDYKVMSSIGFEGISDKKWRIILEAIPIYNLTKVSDDDIRMILSNIKSIGVNTIDNILHNRILYQNDINTALQNLNIEITKISNLPKIVLTGFRDKSFEELLLQYGYECIDGSVTNDTFAVIALNPNSNSTKIAKAKDKGIHVYSRTEFMDKFNIKNINI